MLRTYSQTSGYREAPVWISALVLAINHVPKTLKLLSAAKALWRELEPCRTKLD